jgi:hypothetical protein
MKTFIIFRVIIVIPVLLGLNFHIVKTEDGILYVKKT